MAPKARRPRGSGRGSGNEQPGLTSTPGPAPEAGSAEAGPSSGRVYRSGRAPRNQQIHFPSRRRVVKKYGRTDPARSPIQRTLTQIGYAMPPLTDLHELDSLGRDSDAEDLNSMAQDQSLSGTASSSSAAEPRGSKRRKIAQAVRGTAHLGSSFHTQTLTQFTAKKTGTSSHDDAGDDDDNYGFDATIRDSEDEFSLESPVAKPVVLDDVPAGKGLTATPTKPRQVKDITLDSSQPVFSTPKAKRTEIPSSQPSPFTPLLLLGRYHSPLGTQRSSPLSSKGNGPTVPLLDLDLSPSIGARPGLASRYPKRVIHDSFSTTKSASQGKTPLRVLSPREIAERSALRDSSELRRATIEASPSLSTRDMGSVASITPRPRSEASGNLAGRSSQEIPDSDDEVGVILASYHTEGHAASPTKPGDRVRGGPVIDTINSAPTSPLSSPSISEPSSPTPLHKSRGEMVKKSIVSPHRVVGYGEASSKERDAENPSNDGNQLCSSQADDTQMYSQAVESQRVPLETIRSLGPQTYESDIIISIHPEQVRKIVSGIKDHEFRGYRIPGTVTRFWIYTTQPVCELRYMAAIDPGYRKPGEINSDSGLGNAEFNAGHLVAKFAYKINQVYQLNNPVSLDLMKQNGWVDGPPQRYAFVPPAVVGALLGNLQRALLNHKGTENELSVSQEIEAQLLSDIADTQPSQREQTLATTALSDSSTARKVLDSSPLQGVSQRMPPPGRGTRQSLPQSSEYSSIQAAHHSVSNDLSADKAGEQGPIWPSQATTATSPAAEEEEPAKERARMAVMRTSQSRYASSPIDQGVVVPRPEVDFGPSSISSAKDEFEEDDGPRERRPGVGRPYGSQSSQQSPQLPQMTRGPQTRRLRRQRSALRNAQASSNESTEIELPDSLYEEVRQAPPAVILDSEDSDAG